MKQTDLCIPTKILDQHLVMLGKTGAGKSSALRHIVEYLLEHKKRVCIVDPKGDWWGLKSSADGAGAGFPVIMFGDFKEPKASDVPINQHSGRHVAELITSGNRPCAIGFRGWMTSHMVQFWIDFAAGVFNGNSGELFLVGDEFHNFAPKGKIMDPQAGKCLHWSNRLLSEGRGLGIVCLLASQRPQKVHNDTLTSCETLVAMRVVHAADRGAVEDWIKGCGDKERGKEVLNSLAGMPRGEAFVWSPEIDFGPKRVKFPMFKTFDSFAPPQLQKKVDEKGWADVDLEAVKEKLASVIEQAKQEDPRALRAEISKLRKELDQAKTETAKAARPATEIKTIEKPVVGMKAIKGIQASDAAMRKNIGKMYALKRDMEAALASYQQSVDKLLIEIGKVEKAQAAQISKPVVVQPLPIQAVAKTLSTDKFIQLAHTRGNGDTSVSVGERKTLTAIAQHTEGVTREQITVLTGYKRSTRDKFIQLLRQRNAVENRGDRLFATEIGIGMLGPDFEPLPTGEELRNYWLMRLNGGERKILEVLIEVYPNTVDRLTIDEKTGYRRSTRDKFIQLLRNRQLVEVSGTAVRASDRLF